MEELRVGLEDIRAAAAALSGRVERTPVLGLGAAGAEVVVKAENLQKTGSFKIRGAFNKLRLLDEEQKRCGVIAASAGNHAQGVALAARWLGVRCVVVMPEGAPLTKVVSARRLGADVILHGDGFDQALEEARRIEASEGLTFVHAFDDPAVIAGAGTVGLELAEQAPDADVVLVPVGGGGLISGAAIALKSSKPGIRVIGVQPEGAAALYRSRQAGRPVELGIARTIADGLAVKRPREATLRLIEAWVDDIVLVTDDEIARAILFFLERARLAVEGAGAVGLAALLSGRFPAAGKRVALLASGGNIDVNFLARLIDHALGEEGRYVRLATTVPDRPGGLHRLLGAVTAAQGNVVAVSHDRLQPGVPLGDTEITLTLETRDRQHVEEIIDRLGRDGYTVRTV